MTESQGHHAALIYVMVTTSAVDRAMTDTELARIGEIVSKLPIFDDFNKDSLVKTAQDCGEVLSADDGLEHVLVLIRANLPENLREKLRTTVQIACAVFLLFLAILSADLAPVIFMTLWPPPP